MREFQSVPPVILKQIQKGSRHPSQLYQLLQVTTDISLAYLHRSDTVQYYQIVKVSSDSMSSQSFS